MDDEDRKRRLLIRKRSQRQRAKRRRPVNQEEPSESESSDESQPPALQFHEHEVQGPNASSDGDEEAAGTIVSAASNSNDEVETEAENHEGSINNSASEESNGASSSDGESADMDYNDSSEPSEDGSEASEVESEVDATGTSGEEDNGENYVGDGNDPIYPGAPITLHESLLSIFTLVLLENLTGRLISNILQLIALHCPEGSIVKRTLATFKSYFAKLGSALMVFHYHCSDCIFPLKTKDSVCKKCKKKGNASYFLELPLLHQLQNIFKRENFYEDLQFRFKEDRKHHRDNIEDIYDSQIYKEQVANGFLNNPRNVSFMWYTDGVAVFKSSSFSIWPLCLVINELPYKMRTLPKNILLVGLWFGKGKPNPNIFLRPLYKTMKGFERDGHEFRLFDNSVIHVKGKVICGTCDLPAKSKFLCVKQYNSYYGCPKCMAEGARAVAGGTTVQVYPYELNIRKRTHEETVQFAEQALEARKTDKDAAIFGVKGPTLLSKIVPDIIRCTGIDVMHGVFLGVFKMIVNLWFSSSFSRNPWSVHHLLDILDEKLKKIKSPSFVERAPRSLKEIRFWKASEFKQFMLYYSVPLLKNILEEPYFRHHCLLVSAIALLSQDSISIDQVQAASALLTSYVADFARLYPLRYLGLNVHQLLHLADTVLEIGPCFVYSCFFLENYNGVINKMFHGTQHIAMQVCSTVSMMMKVPEFRSHLPPDSKVQQFCLRLEQGFNRKIADVIDDSSSAVGTYSYDPAKMRHSAYVIREKLRKENGTCCVFFRLQRRGVLYFSEEYPRTSLRKESSFITYKEDDILKVGRIIRFARWSNCQNVCDIDCRDCPAEYVAIIREFQRQLWFIHDVRDVRISYIFQVKSTDSLTAIDVQSIQNLCFYFESDGEEYIANRVNRLERE